MRASNLRSVEETNEARPLYSVKDILTSGNSRQFLIWFSDVKDISVRPNPLFPQQPSLVARDRTHRTRVEPMASPAYAPMDIDLSFLRKPVGVYTTAGA